MLSCRDGLKFNTAGMTTPRKDGLDAWKVLGGGSKSSSVQIVSGQTFLDTTVSWSIPGKKNERKRSKRMVSARRHQQVEAFLNDVFRRDCLTRRSMHSTWKPDAQKESFAYSLMTSNS